MNIRESAIKAYYDEMAAIMAAQEKWVLECFGWSLADFAAERIEAKVVGDPRPPGGTAGLSVKMAEQCWHDPIASLVELGALLVDCAIIEESGMSCDTEFYPDSEGGSDADSH